MLPDLCVHISGYHKTHGNVVVASFSRELWHAFDCMHACKVNRPPQGGSCDVRPRRGIVLKTEFKLECTNFTDEHTEELKYDERACSCVKILLFSVHVFACIYPCNQTHTLMD